jgi:hypothetical protein
MLQETDLEIYFLNTYIRILFWNKTSNVGLLDGDAIKEFDEQPWFYIFISLFVAPQSIFLVAILRSLDRIPQLFHPLACHVTF